MMKYFSKFTHIFLYQLKLSNINLEILIPFEFILHRHNIFGIPNLPFMGFFEVLLKLIELSTKALPLILDLVQSLSHVHD